MSAPLDKKPRTEGVAHPSKLETELEKARQDVRLAEEELKKVKAETEKIQSERALIRIKTVITVVAPIPAWFGIKSFLGGKEGESEQLKPNDAKANGLKSSLASPSLGANSLGASNVPPVNSHAADQGQVGRSGDPAPSGSEKGKINEFVVKSPDNSISGHVALVRGPAAGHFTVVDSAWGTDDPEVVALTRDIEKLGAYVRSSSGGASEKATALKTLHKQLAYLSEKRATSPIIGAANVYGNDMSFAGLNVNYTEAISNPVQSLNPWFLSPEVSSVFAPLTSDKYRSAEPKPKSWIDFAGFVVGVILLGLVAMAVFLSVKRWVATLAAKSLE